MWKSEGGEKVLVFVCDTKVDSVTVLVPEDEECLRC